MPKQVSVGASINTPTGVLEALNNVSTTKNLRLVGNPQFIGTNIDTTLEFAPLNSGASFINYVSGQLHFSFNGTEVARFGASTTANYIVYNNMSVGYGSGGIAPSLSSLEVYQTGNTNVNLKLSGKTTGDNSYLTFNPFSGALSMTSFRSTGSRGVGVIRGSIPSTFTS